MGHSRACTMTGLHVRPNSDAMNPEARCRPGRPCRAGSQSRNRLSEILAWPVLCSCVQPAGSVRADPAKPGGAEPRVHPAPHTLVKEAACEDLR